MLQLYCQVVNKLQEMLETDAVKRPDWCDGTFGTVARLCRTQIDPFRVCVPGKTTAFPQLGCIWRQM